VTIINRANWNGCTRFVFVCETWHQKLRSDSCIHPWMAQCNTVSTCCDFSMSYDLGVPISLTHVTGHMHWEQYM